MKCFIGIVILCVINNISSVPVKNGLTYYQAPAFNGYFRPYPMQQTMLLHYNNPYYARTSHASEITAFASGDKIGTGTYYQDIPQPKQYVEAPPPPSPPSPSLPPSLPKLSNDVTEEQSSEPYGNAISIAEAYPQVEESQETESEETESHQQEDALFEPNPSISYEPLPQQEKTKPTLAPANSIIVSPSKNDVETENDENVDDGFVPVVSKVKGSGQGSWPLNNFFPISFGGTSGGAIAIANSFSTGKGTAVSRATAYGSSSKQKLNKQLSQ